MKVFQDGCNGELEDQRSSDRAVVFSGVTNCSLPSMSLGSVKNHTISVAFLREGIWRLYCSVCDEQGCALASDTLTVEVSASDGNRRSSTASTSSLVASSVPRDELIPVASP